MDAHLLAARREIFEAFAAGEDPPRLDAAVLRALAERHVVVLRGGRVWMAHPFAAHRWGTQVTAPDGRSWWGNCAWDGLGIVAALGLTDATLVSGGLAVHVRGGAIVDHALFHVAVPARHWWDDIEHT
jgi:hypothetical protein